MTELSAKSLAQIVTSNHKAAMVFEKYQLDFCCKGKRTLQQACAENDIQVEEVVSDLEKTGLDDGNSIHVDFEKLTVAQLADYIVSTHHSFVKKEMPAILGYLQKVSSKHGERHPEVVKVFQLFHSVCEEMELHMKKEEVILFPRIKEIESHHEQGKELMISPSYLQAPIQMMEQEHDHAGALLAEIRALTNNYEPPVDACTTFRLSYACLQAFELDLHQHVHLENNILFPKALRLFSYTRQSLLN